MKLPAAREALPSGRTCRVFGRRRITITQYYPVEQRSIRVRDYLDDCPVSS